MATLIILASWAWGEPISPLMFLPSLPFDAVSTFVLGGIWIKVAESIGENAARINAQVELRRKEK